MSRAAAQSTPSIMRQGVDFSPADVPGHNPLLTPAAVMRRLSMAHALAGGAEAQAEVNARVSAASYCELSRALCGVHGGVYCDGNGSCTAETYGDFQDMLKRAGVPADRRPVMAAVNPSNPSGSVVAAQPVPASLVSEYEKFWMGRTNLDAVDSQYCAAPCVPGGQVAGFGGVAPGPSTPVDTQCYRACVTAQGGNAAGCDLLCATQPTFIGTSTQDFVMPRNVIPAAERIPLDPMFPVGVALDGCVRQCNATQTVAEQAACRAACASLTGAPTDLVSPVGGCLDQCLAQCGPSDAACQSQCQAVCSGAVMDPAVSPAQSVPFSFQ